MPDIPTDVREFPAPLRFAVRGHAFQIDLLDSIYVLRDLSEQVHREWEEMSEEARSSVDAHRRYLERVVEYVREIGGVSLTYGEADWFSDYMGVELAQTKKKRVESLHDAQR